MRILHLVTRSHRRGAEVVAVELADELDAIGHENHLRAIALAADAGEDVRLPPLARRTGLAAGALVATWRLRLLLRRRPFDIVLAHGGLAAQVAALAVPRGGPIVVWQRILPFPAAVWRPARRRWWRAVSRRVDAAIALTPDLEQELRRLGFSGPVATIPNSRRPERFLAIDRAAMSADLRRETGVVEGVALVGFLGHLVEQKRPELALEVLSRMHAAGEKVHLVIAGDGHLRARLEQETKDRGLGHHVSMLGHRDDIERVLGGVDVLLLTSDTEGIPGVAIEALMAGCPVVTFPVGGVAEVVEHDVTGVVLERSDTGLMADRAIALLRDPDLRRRMGERARARTPHFSAARTARMYVTEFERLLSDRLPDGVDGMDRVVI